MKGQPELEVTVFLGCRLLRLHDPLNHRVQLGLESLRVLLGVPLGVDVHERFVGVGQNLGPAAFLEDLDPVRQIELPVAQPLTEDAHHEPLHRPRARQLAVDERRDWQLADKLRERPARRREQLQQLAQARDGVVGGQELRKDVAAAERAGEDDAVLGGELGQLGDTRRGSDDLEPGSFRHFVDLARDSDREGELAAPAVGAEQPDQEQQRLLDGDLPASLVDQEEPLGGPVEDGAEIRTDRGNEPLRLTDGFPQRRRAGGGRVGNKGVRGDRLGTEGSEHERQHVGGGRVTVVDDDPETALPNRGTVERGQQVLRVCLAHAGRIADAADGIVGSAPKLEAREILLDLFLHRRGQLDARILEEADLDDLRIRVADPDVEARVEALRLQQVAVDGGRQHPQVCHVDAGRVEPSDHRPLDHPAPGRRVAAADDPVAALQRGSQRSGEANRNLGRDVDVDQSGDALAGPQARGRARLEDQALRHLGAGFDVLVRVDPDTRIDDALGAQGHFVADRGPLLDEDVRADVAAPADDRALDHGAAADVGRGVDHAPARPRLLAKRHARAEDRVCRHGRSGSDPRVVADERGRLDLLQVVELDSLPQPDVPAQANAWDVQAHRLVEGVEVRLTELVEVADVLPVLVEDVAVERTAHLEQQREELLREVVGSVGGYVAQHLRLEHVDAGVDPIGDDLASGRLLQEALDPAFVVGDDDPELERVLDRLEPDRDRGFLLAVEVDDLLQVHIRERIAGDDDEGVVELPARQPDGAGGAERRLLDGVLDVDAERLPVAEVAADGLRQEGDCDDHVLHSVAAQKLDDVLHAGLADDRNHRLRLVRRQWAKARALAAGHDDRFHASTTSRFAFAR